MSFFPYILRKQGYFWMCPAGRGRGWGDMGCSDPVGALPPFPLPQSSVLAPWVGVRGVGGAQRPWALGKGQTASLTSDLVLGPTQHTAGCSGWLPVCSSLTQDLSLKNTIHQSVSRCLLTAYCVLGWGWGPLQPHGGGEGMLTGEAAWGGSLGAMSPLRVFPQTRTQGAEERAWHVAGRSTKAGAWRRVRFCTPSGRLRLPRQHSADPPAPTPYRAQFTPRQALTPTSGLVPLRAVEGSTEALSLVRPCPPGHTCRFSPAHVTGPSTSFTRTLVHGTLVRAWRARLAFHPLSDPRGVVSVNSR